MKERYLQINDKEIIILLIVVFPIIIGCLLIPILIKPEIITILGLDPFVLYLIDIKPSSYQKITQINNEEFALHLFQLHAATLIIALSLTPISIIITFFVLWRYANITEMKKFREQDLRECATPEYVERNYNFIMGYFWFIPDKIIKSFLIKSGSFRRKYPKIKKLFIIISASIIIHLTIFLPTYLSNVKVIANNNILNYYIKSIFAPSIILALLVQGCVIFWIHVYPRRQNY